MVVYNMVACCKRDWKNYSRRLEDSDFGTPKLCGSRVLARGASKSISCFFDALGQQVCPSLQATEEVGNSQSYLRPVQAEPQGLPRLPQHQGHHVRDVFGFL